MASSQGQTTTVAQTFLAAKAWESKCQASRKELDQLQSVLGTVLKDLGFDATKVLGQLGAKGQVVDSNMMQCLGLLEEKANELLLQWEVLQHPSGAAVGRSKSHSIAFSELLLDTGQAQPCSMGPNMDSVPDIIEALEEPLDWQQIRRLVLQSREQQLGPGAGGHPHLEA